MVDIVIVNWNSGNFLRKCLATVFMPANENIISKVYIIDNNTTDTSLDHLPENEKLVIIRNTYNAGFSKASNQGFRLCTAPFVLLLNPDTQLFESTLSDCLEYLNANSIIDILGCTLLDDSGTITKSCARFPTPGRMFFDAVGLAKIAPRIFKPASLMTDWDHKESRAVDQVMGAFMFMRRSVFDKAGYFDEQYFVYYEELDFSKRLAGLGGTSYFNAKISAIHSVNGTTNAVKGFRLSLNLRSRLQYAKKHFSFPGYVLVWISTIAIEPFSRSAALIFSGRFREIKDIFIGYRLLMKPLKIN